MKKSKLISGKKFAGVRGIRSIVGLFVLVSVIMTVGLAIVSGGYLLRAVRRKSRKKETLGNPVEGERDSGLKPNTIPL